tara:strand:- start:465 stop:2672 length:2208 start_codon:yes stop_codon:yes gene_type:complete
MSIFIQEVLSLLQRKKVKETLDLQHDYFEFGRKVKSVLNPSYGPRMEPLAIKAQDFVCTVTKGLTATSAGSGATGFIPVYADASGPCLIKTLQNSILTQTGIESITVNGGLKLGGYLADGTGLLGTSGQVLSSTGTEVLWVDATAGSGTVTRVGALDGTFISSSSPDITVSGDLTYDLSATGIPSSTVFLRGDNTWARAVQSFSNANGTFITATTHSLTTGDIDMGTVDLSATGTPSSSTYLRGDNTWSTIPAGSGTVESVGLSTDIAAFQIANSPVTTTGVLGLNLLGGTAGQFLRQDGAWATIPGGNIGTVTNVDATINGDAYTATVVDPTGAVAITIEPQGSVLQYINGLGNTIALSTLPQGTVTVVSASHGGDAFSAAIGNNANVNPEVQITMGGLVTEYINGLGNRIALSTLATSFSLSGDTGVAQNITDGDTLSVIGGTGLSSITSNLTPDSVVVNLDNTGVTAGEYDNANIIVNAQGQITFAEAGTTGTGTVTSIATGAGISGGTITDSGTIILDVNSSTATTDSANADWFSIANTAGTTYKIAPGDIDLSTMNNDSGWTSNAGTVTNVTGGNGITVGSLGSSYAVSIDLLGANPGLSFQGFGSDELAVDGTVVRTSGNQTIAGVKTFTDNVIGTGTFTGTNFILSSDERLKDNVIDLEPKAIDTKWKSFTMKDSSEDYRVGLIAQELEVTNPEFVVTDDAGFKSVKYIDLLIAKIAELEARLEKAGI